MLEIVIVVLVVGAVVFVLVNMIGLPQPTPPTPPLAPLPCDELPIEGMDAPAVVSGSATLESTTNSQDVAIVRARFSFRGDTGETTLRLRRVERFVGSQGGWVQDAPEVILDAGEEIDRWRIGREIPAGEAVEVEAPGDLVCDAPASVMLFVQPAGPPERTLPLLAQVPVRTTPETAWFRWPESRVAPPHPPPDVPAPLFPVHAPVAIALQGNVHVVPVAGRATEWAVVTGQILNLAGLPLHVASFRCLLLDAEDRPLGARELPLHFHDTLAGPDAPPIDMAAGPSGARLLGFSVALERLPTEPRWAAILLEGCVSVDGGAPFLVDRIAGIDSDFFGAVIDRTFGAPVPRVQGKVWQALNGPQAAGFNRHNLRLRERFAYDLVLGEQLGIGVRLRRAGTPGDQNEHFFVHQEPLPARAMANGTVLWVQEAEGENEGTVANPDSVEGHVEILHSNGVIARYRHLRPRSPELLEAFPGLDALEQGRPVARGETIGVIGNSGVSDQPHLHVECWRIDPSTGAFLSVPFGFDDILDVNRRPARGVLPHGAVFDVTAP